MNDEDKPSSRAQAEGKEQEEKPKTEENKAEEAPLEAEEEAKEQTPSEPKEEAKEAPQEVKEEAKEEPSEQAPEKPDQKEEAKEAPSASQPKQEEKPADKSKKEVKVSGKLADIIKEIEGLTVIELADLVKALEDKFGVSATPTMVGVAGAAPAAGGEEAGPEEGQTTFNVVLAESGATKISVIKAVRELVPTLGLKEAKDLVDSAPKQVLEGVGKDAANEAKAKLEAAGAKVELK